MCEITRFHRGSFRVKYGKNSSHFKIFSLTPLVALATNIRCECELHIIHVMWLIFVLRSLQLCNPVKMRPIRSVFAGELHWKEAFVKCFYRRCLLDRPIVVGLLLGA